MRGLIGIGAISLTLVFAGTAIAGGGAAVYQSRCLMCHGVEGAGTPMGPAFKGSAYLQEASVADIVKVVTEGRSGAAKKYKQFPMGVPAQKGVLSEADIKEVVDYIKGLAK